MLFLTDASDYHTDRGAKYLRYYEAVFKPIKQSVTSVLELGTQCQGSLEIWRDYFERADIVAVTPFAAQLQQSERLSVFDGRPSDSAIYDLIEDQLGLRSFDIIIDDASHVAADVDSAIRLLFSSRLKPGGIYVIEDWGVGYFDGWPDGGRYECREPSLNEMGTPIEFHSHNAGVVGYLKALIDHVGRADIHQWGGQIAALPIEHLSITQGLLFLHKAP